MEKFFTTAALILLLAGCGEATSHPANESTVTPASTEPPSAREVSFTTADGISLSGTMRGDGHTAIIFSHMSDGDRGDWRDLPQKMADMGYITLAYDFRGRGLSAGAFNPPAANIDLSAAINFARKESATELALVGASMGAMTSAKAAAREQPAALVFLAGTTSWQGLTVSDAEVASTNTPKLFISSEGDPYIQGILHLFEVATEPKEKFVYPGSAHGTDLFDEFGDDLTGRIIDFISEHAPPK